MASPRPAFGLPAKPSDGYRPRKMQDIRSPGSTPKPLSLKTKKIPEPSRIVTEGLSKSRLPSRVPQPSPTQLPPRSQPIARYSDHKSQSGSSTRTVDSTHSNSHTASGSSSSSRSYDSSNTPARNGLRRKKSSISREPNSPWSDSAHTSSTSSLPRYRISDIPGFNMQFDRTSSGSPVEMQRAVAPEVSKPVGQSPVIYPELDRYRDFQRPVYSSEDLGIHVPFRLATQDLPPPTPTSLLFSGNSSQVSANSASPSTRFSESPGPGPYSRDTTPASMSSQSPGLVAPSRFNPPRVRQNSPAQSRPPVTRRRAGSFSNDINSTFADPQGLPAVRESLTSSSSNSTVREGDRAAKGENKSARQLPQSIPSPPPRKSSQNFHPSEMPRPSPKKVQQGGRQPVVMSPPPLRINTTNTRPKLSSPVSAPPRRPSRDGTPDFQSQFFGPLPVIHSNLSTTSLPGERRGSESAPASALPRSATPSMPTKNASATHLPLTREISATSDNGASNLKTSKPVVAAAPPVSRTPSPVVTSASTSRFPFFGRKKRTTEEAPKTENKESKKLTRKGPAAGTGHEGYGRLGAIRRRSGSISNFVRGAPEPLSSQESLIRSDQFLADRLNPVIIAGGEIIENRNASPELSRISSNQSIALSQFAGGRRPSMESSTASGIPPRTSNKSVDISRAPRLGLRSRRPSDSSDSENLNIRSNLAQRRSVQRLRTSPDSPPLRIPQPINTSGVAASPMTSFDTSIMSDESHLELQREISRGSIDPHPAPKKLMNRTRSPRKWKLFSRSPAKSSPPKVQDKQVTATVTVVEQKPVAFYTMMETSDPDEDEVLDIRDVLQNADVYMSPTKGGNMPETSSSIPPPPELPPLQTSTPPEPTRPTPIPVMAPTKPPVTQVPTPPRLNTNVGVGRASRLPQVGRIPKVISNQPGHASPRSFSRPFRSSVLLPSPAFEVREQSPLVREQSPLVREQSPVVQEQSPLVPSEPLQNVAAEEPTPVSSGSVISAAATRGEKDFITFFHRKDSFGTIGTSSSSSGTANAFAVATAVIPKPHDPPAEDEIWDEYDDLLGDEHNKIRASTTSSHGVPFHLETYETKLMKDGKPLESPTIFTETRKLSTYSRAPTHSTSYSADMTERIRAAFQPHNSPPISAHNSMRPLSHKRQSQSLDLGRKPVFESRRSSSSSCKTRKSIDSSSSSPSSSDDGSPLAQVNLRVGSMTVSKWLTFGHVLFSDIRHELVPVEGSLKRESILVMDGLGNDDWSFYAAETYPAATFFNLSPRAPLPPELQNSPTSFPLSPPNHHQVQHLSQADKFPFAPQSFTCFVYRFPVAAPESYYRNILTEARRVLKPGGYIELSILDVDLNNMGNRGRRTVRKLKERIHEQQPDINLSSTADLIVRLLGKYGFSGIKAARVGVPVASSIARSNSQRKKDKKDQPSLSDMMSDNSAVADENITKMVARVGRWWYTRCYENAAVMTDDQKSIWSDNALLSECEELGTSLKLMVCCARAPERITSI